MIRAWTRSLASRHLHIPDQTADPNRSPTDAVRVFVFAEEVIHNLLELCSGLLTRLEDWQERHGARLPDPVRERLQERLAMVVTLLDQVHDRLLNNQSIPASEKMYSVFEPHTRWISKGKAGRPQELGVPVAILEDQHQFILGHRVMWQESDIDAAVPLVRDCQKRWPELCAVSFDRGFHSPRNRQELDSILDLNALPAKGRLGAEAKVRESEAEFVAARR